MSAPLDMQYFIDDTLYQTYFQISSQARFDLINELVDHLEPRLTDILRVYDYS